MTARPAMLDLRDIDAHPGNVRTAMAEDELNELAQSLRENGMLQPILVQPTGMRFRLVAGHRRCAAARLAGMRQVPAVIRDDLSDSDVVAAMLVENLQRAALNPIEEARAIAALRDSTDPTPNQGELARRIGRSPYWVGTRLSLLELPAHVQTQVATGKLRVNEAEDLVVAQRREDAGKAPDEKASRGWDDSPWWLTKGHPLASSAKHVCDQLGHSARRRLQSIACGSCWEEVIRADERRKSEARLAALDSSGDTP